MEITLDMKVHTLIGAISDHSWLHFLTIIPLRTSYALGYKEWLETSALMLEAIISLALNAHTAPFNLGMPTSVDFESLSNTAYFYPIPLTLTFFGMQNIGDCLIAIWILSQNKVKVKMQSSTKASNNSIKCNIRKGL